ncbi:hypothetical protein I4U23_022890 [Adineta vaga]|nr:hypothetical protein I4U23_022890 [Adineta vaga]
MDKPHIKGTKNALKIYTTSKTSIETNLRTHHNNQTQNGSVSLNNFQTSTLLFIMLNLLYSIVIMWYKHFVLANIINNTLYSSEKKNSTSLQSSTSTTLILQLTSVCLLHFIFFLPQFVIILPTTITSSTSNTETSTSISSITTLRSSTLYILLRQRLRKSLQNTSTSETSWAQYAYSYTAIIKA